MEPTQQKSYYTIQNNCITSLGTKKDHTKIVKIVKTIIHTSDHQRNQVTQHLSSEDLMKIKQLYQERFAKWSLPDWIKSILRGLTEVTNADIILTNLISEKTQQKVQEKVQDALEPNLKESLALPTPLNEIVNNSSEAVKTHYQSYNRHYANAESTEQLANCKLSLELLYDKITAYEADQLGALSAKIPLTHGQALQFVQKKINEDKALCSEIDKDIKQSPKNQAQSIEYLEGIQKRAKKYALQIELLKTAQERKNQNANEKEAHNQLQTEIVNADLNTLERQKDKIKQLLESKTALTKEAVEAIFPPETLFQPVSE